MIDGKHPPHSPEAVILMKFDGDQTWSHEGHVPQNMAQLGSTSTSLPGVTPVGFFGLIPMAFAGAPGNPPRSADLLQALATAHAATVMIGGHGDGPQPKIEEMIAGNKFNLDDKAGRDALAVKALAQAMAAAKNPKTCKAPQ